MANKLTIQDINITGKRILMRVDFNVPLEQGRVANDKRIRAAIPTIRHILDHGGKLILMSHLGRPKGKKQPDLSLKPVGSLLEKLLEKNVGFVEDCIGEAVETAVNNLNNGELLLLENLRFYKQETDNEDLFAAHLARLGDVYVNDAFGTAHRAHASTLGVTRHIPTCVAGFLLMKELEYLNKIMEKPEKPFAAILGGAKISDKINVISNLLKKVDTLIIGGGMAYTFYKAKGFEIGKSLLEEEKIGLAKELLDIGKEKIMLPADCVVSDAFDFNARKTGELKEVKNRAIPEDAYGLDIGTAAIKQFSDILTQAKTIVWNGPMGVFEIEATAKGTYEIARLLAQATDNGATTVIGGGDSAAAVKKAGVADRISHVSTGGGASLEFLEGKILPGVAALSEKQT